MIDVSAGGSLMLKFINVMHSCPTAYVIKHLEPNRYYLMKINRNS